MKLFFENYLHCGWRFLIAVFSLVFQIITSIYSPTLFSFLCFSTKNTFTLFAVLQYISLFSAFPWSSTILLQRATEVGINYIVLNLMVNFFVYICTHSLETGLSEAIKNELTNYLVVHFMIFYRLFSGKWRLENLMTIWPDKCFYTEFFVAIFLKLLPKSVINYMPYLICKSFAIKSERILQGVTRTVRGDALIWLAVN